MDGFHRIEYGTSLFRPFDGTGINFDPTLYNFIVKMALLLLVADKGQVFTGDFLYRAS